MRKRKNKEAIVIIAVISLIILVSGIYIYLTSNFYVNKKLENNLINLGYSQTLDKKMINKYQEIYNEETNQYFYEFSNILDKFPELIYRIDIDNNLLEIYGINPNNGNVNSLTTFDYKENILTDCYTSIYGDFFNCNDYSNLKGVGQMRVNFLNIQEDYNNEDTNTIFNKTINYLGYTEFDINEMEI